MQSVSSRIWTRVAMSLSYDDNHKTTGTSGRAIIWTDWLNLLIWCWHKFCNKMALIIIFFPSKFYNNFFHSSSRETQASVCTLYFVCKLSYRKKKPFWIHIIFFNMTKCTQVQAHQVCVCSCICVHESVCVCVCMSMCVHIRTREHLSMTLCCFVFAKYVDEKNTI